MLKCYLLFITGINIAVLLIGAWFYAVGPGEICIITALHQNKNETNVFCGPVVNWPPYKLEWPNDSVAD